MEKIEERYIGKDYYDHKVFQTLKDIIGFYGCVSYRSFSFPIYPLKNGLRNLDCDLFSSIGGTLESVSVILMNGRINDGYSLLRKYNDAIVIQTYIEIEALKGNPILKNFDAKSIGKLEEWTLKVNDFVKDDKKMYKTILEHEKLKEINGIMNIRRKDSDYSKYRDLCNDNVHYNSFKYFLLNKYEYNEGVYKKEALKALDELDEIVKNLFCLHFAYIKCLHGEYFMEDIDFVDPKLLQEGYQLGLCPFVTDMIENYVKPFNPQLTDYLLRN